MHVSRVYATPLAIGGFWWGVGQFSRRKRLTVTVVAYRRPDTGPAAPRSGVTDTRNRNRSTTSTTRW